MLIWKKKKKKKKYCNNLKYWDRQACANSEYLDQTLQNVDLIWVYTVCHSPSTILDTSTGSKIDLFKF